MSEQNQAAASQNGNNIGILYGVIAALIWGSWPVVTAFGMREANFQPLDLVTLRLAIAGVILLPWAFRGDRSLKSWVHSIVLTLLAGGTYSYMSASGFQYSSAIHGGVIIPGTVMLFGLIASHLWLGDKLNRNRVLGALAIVAGLTLLAAGSEGGGASLIGDAIFFTAGLMWAAYTLLLRVWPMDPLIITARVSVLSLAGLILIYPFTQGVDYSNVSTGMMILQVSWQGFLSAIVAIVLFNKGVVILGPAKAGVVNSLVPVISMILAFLVLAEVPTGLEQAGLLLIMAGIAIIMFLKEKNLVRTRLAAQNP